MAKADVSQVPRVPAGSEAGGQWTSSGASRIAEARAAGTSNAKAIKALATHKPSTKEKQDLATQAEKRIAAMLGAEPTGDNLPVDVVVRRGNRTWGVEVKSVSDNGNNKLTMHPESLARKEKWAKSNHGSLHTIAVDMRSRTVMYRKGAGSFRLHTMTVVKNAAHLHELMGLPPP